MVITMDAVIWEQIRKKILKVTHKFKNLFSDFNSCVKKIKMESEAQLKVCYFKSYIL